MIPLERAVKKACASANPGDIKNALLDWARVRWPRHNVASLADIASLCPAELSQQIHRLNATLYTSHDDDWDPKALLSAFHAFISVKQKQAKAQDSILEPLYKT